MKEPYFEDVVRYYLHYSLSQLFPKKTKNKFIVYLIGFFHLLGGIVIQYSPFILSPPNLIYYISFVILNLLGYVIFENNCFMTLLTNYYGGLKDHPLRMRWSIFKSFLLFNLTISIIGFYYPKYAPINWLNIISKL